MTDSRLNVVALLFPNLTQLDFTGPGQVFSKLPHCPGPPGMAQPGPGPHDAGWCIVPTTTLEDCPPADVLFVPGGAGTFDLFEDDVAPIGDKSW